MGMSLGGGGGVKSDINVTPLVDVMLVLLIIMMIVAPMLQKGVDVKLPVAANTTDKPETSNQTVLGIMADQTLFINSVKIDKADLQKRLEELLRDKTEKIVLIKADENVDYGAVMGAMDVMRAGGIEDMGLITERKLRPGQTGGK